MADTPQPQATDRWVIGMGAALILLWVFLLLVFNTRERPSKHYDIKHPVYADTMKHGGDGTMRHSDLLLTGWAFGSAQFLFFTGLLAWATCLPRRSARPPRTWLFLLGGLLIEGAFTCLCWSYHASLRPPIEDFPGPFPPGLLWLLFGIWLTPGFLIAMYVMHFQVWIFSDADQEKFEQLKNEFSPVVSSSAAT